MNDIDNPDNRFCIPQGESRFTPIDLSKYQMAVINALEEAPINATTRFVFMYPLRRDGQTTAIIQWIRLVVKSGKRVDYTDTYQMLTQYVWETLGMFDITAPATGDPPPDVNIRVTHEKILTARQGVFVPYAYFRPSSHCGPFECDVVTISKGSATAIQPMIHQSQ